MKKVKITDVPSITNPKRDDHVFLNVGGVLSKSSLEYFELKSRALSNCDLALESGIYQCNNDVLNAPRSGQGAASGGILVAFKGHDRRLAQIYMITGIGVHEMFFRTRSYQVDAAFSNWVKLG